ncbi:MAG: hypothetical protein LUE12_05155 [Ruminococcus sp.]|nr:hypothetical protein [Ruminococcus sp.]
MRKFFKACCIAFSVVLVSCSDTVESAVGYEQIASAAGQAIYYEDEASYLSCWLPYEKAQLVLSDEYQEGFVAEMFDGDEYQSKLRTQITDSTELSEEEIAQLESDAQERYGVCIDFTKAQQLEVRFSAQRSGKTYEDVRELTAVRFSNSWYLYGDVIISFDFVESET